MSIRDQSNQDSMLPAGDVEKAERFSAETSEGEGEREIAMLLSTGSKQMQHVDEKRAYSTWYLILAIVVIAMMGASVLLWRVKHNLVWIPCGSTAEEAIAANCHYEPMLRGWIPDACYFPDPSDEYDPFHDREWYIDSNLTIRADMQKVIAGKEDYLVFSKHFHMEHCLYAWRKLAIAVERKLPMLDSKSASLGHSSHCSKQVAKMLQTIWDGTFEDTLFSTGKTSSPTLFLECVEI